ncbi:MAG: hypothetical protein ACJ76Z_04770 [Thermoleophilaceae bacterium]
MLFDLQGKRRRMVQATYLILAVLMGGGLVLFGIGSGSVSGGLFDAITGKNSNSGGGSSSLVAKRITSDQKALRLNPKNTAAMTDLVRAHYQLATDDSDQNTGQFGDQGKAELRKASAAWKLYLNTAKKVDPSLAGLMLNAYSQIGLNQAPDAAEAAQFVAEARPSAAAYLQLTAYAAQAGNSRLATLAGQKAIALAPKSQKKLVKQQVAAAKASPAGGTATSGG